MFVIKFIIGMLIIEIYYFVNFLTESSFLDKCHILGKELNKTASIEPYFWYTLNV
jgi:hypothetical protein